MRPKARPGLPRSAGRYPWLLPALLMAAAGAQADGKVFVPSNEKWQAECGGCHIAYPPQLLPAASWRALMSGLDKHFGSDASLDSASAAEITAFLDRHAAPARQNTSAKPLLRITDTAWFMHEHDDLPAATWRNPKVKSPANCDACHTRADSGDYRERGLRVPR